MAWQCCINNWVKQCDLWTADVFAFPNNDKYILVSSLLMESNHLVRADCDARRIAHRELWTLQMPFVRVGIVYTNKHEEISKSVSRSSWPSWVRVAKVHSEADSCHFIWFGAAWINSAVFNRARGVEWTWHWTVSVLQSTAVFCCCLLRNSLEYLIHICQSVSISSQIFLNNVRWPGQFCITDRTSSLLRIQ